MNTRIYIFIISLMVTSLTGVYSQNECLQNSSKQCCGMKKIDIEKFYENNNEGLTKTETLNNGDEVSYSAINSGFIMRVNSKDSTITYYSFYNKNGNIIRHNKSFHNILVGSDYYYDNNGNQIKVIDVDALYPFSLDDFRGKAKNEFDVDVFKKDFGLQINRFYVDEKKINRPFYHLQFTDKGDEYKYHDILIDGNNGDILYNELLPISKYSVNEEDKNRNPLKEYIQNLINKTSSEPDKKGFWSSLLD